MNISNQIFKNAFGYIEKNYGDGEKIILEEKDFNSLTSTLYDGIDKFLGEQKSKDSDLEVNFKGIVTFGVEYDEDEDQEKAGSYIPYMKLGKVFKDIIGINDKEKESKPKDKEIKRFISSVCDLVGFSDIVAVEECKRGLDETAEILIEARLIAVAETIAEALKENDSVVVEEGDSFTIRATRGDDGAITAHVVLQPASKLAVKSDAETEV